MSETEPPQDRLGENEPLPQEYWRGEHGLLPCGAIQISKHLIEACPVFSHPHGVQGPKDLDDETIKWLHSRDFGIQVKGKSHAQRRHVFKGLVKKYMGDRPEEMKTRFLKKNMTHPLVMAQNFGDQPPTSG